MARADTPSSPDLAPDAIGLLTRDHRLVDELFTEVGRSHAQQLYPLVRRIFGHHGDLEGPSRFTWVKNVLFLAVLTFVSILALYPFIWLISASLKPQGDVFDNALIPHHFQWNYTGDPSPTPGDERLFDLPDLPVLRWFVNSVWIGLVAAGLVAGLLRAPFAVAVLLAAGVAAGLRLLGVQ